jgi:hypothetical protein
MEQIVTEPQGHQPRKTAAEAVAEVVQSRTFREVAGIRPPSMKKSRVTTALQVREIRAGLNNEKQRGHNCGRRLLNRRPR